jgi:hypothetical protein
MREWVRRHKHELDPQRTVVLNVDEAGYGTVRYATSDRADSARSGRPSLLELCDEVRAEGHAGRFGAAAMPQLGLAEGAVAARHGFRVIRIACLPEPTFAPEYHRPTDAPERLDLRAPERAFEFCSRLIEKIDGQLAGDPSKAGPARTD